MSIKVGAWLFPKSARLHKALRVTNEEHSSNHKNAWQSAFQKIVTNGNQEERTQDIEKEVIENVSPSVHLTGVVLHQPDRSILWNGVNGVYQRSHEMCNGQPVYSRLTMPWAIWLSKVEPSDDEAARNCWCVGKKEMVGTDSMFAYIESMGLGLEEAGSQPWTVYSYKSNSWETQTGIEVLRIEPSAPKEVMLVDQNVERAQLRRVRELPSDEADKHEKLYERPQSRQSLSQVKQALTCQSEKSRAVAQQLSEWSCGVLSDIDTKIEWQAAQKVDDEAGATEGKTVPGSPLFKRVSTASQQVASVLQGGKSPAQDNVIHVTKQGKSRNVGNLRKLQWETQCEVLLCNLDISKGAFRCDVHTNISQWVGVPRLFETLTSALRARPDYAENWSKLLLFSEKEAGGSAYVKSSLQQEESFILDLAADVEEWDETVDADLRRMHASVENLQSLSESDSCDVFAACRHEALSMAAKLKKDIQALSTHVLDASRVIAWLEFEQGDARGRLEYIGQLLPQEGEGEANKSQLEDGLGVMTWRDGSTYAGLFRRGVLDGFGHETYIDGSNFKGQFVNDCRHGLGVYSMPSGERYTGEWINGALSGEGIASGGSLANVFGTFLDGELEQTLEEDERKAALILRISEVINTAMEIAGTARALIPTIRDKTTEVHIKCKRRKAIKAFFAREGPTLVKRFMGANESLEPSLRAPTLPPSTITSPSQLLTPSLTPTREGSEMRVDTVSNKIAVLLEYNNLTTQESFEAFDEDADNAISMADLTRAAGMHFSEVDAATLEEWFQTYNTSGSGMMSKEEWNRAMNAAKTKRKQSSRDQGKFSGLPGHTHLQQDDKPAAGPAVVRPETPVGPADKLQQTRLPKPYDSMETWVSHINLCDLSGDRGRHLLYEDGGRIGEAALVKRESERIANKIREQGYRTPAELLALLSDVDAFDAFADKVQLRARHLRVLWKALQDLDVALTPPGTPMLMSRPTSRGIENGVPLMSRPASREAFLDPLQTTVAQDKLKDLSRLFNKYADERDRKDQPCMGTHGLSLALTAMNLQHEKRQLDQIMIRIDSFNHGQLDFDEFVYAVTEWQKCIANAEQEWGQYLIAVEQERKKRAAEELYRMRKVAELEERALIEAEEERIEAERRAKLSDQLQPFLRRHLARTAFAQEAERRAKATDQLQRFLRRHQARNVFGLEWRLRLHATKTVQRWTKHRLACMFKNRYLEEIERRQRAVMHLKVAGKRALARNAFGLEWERRKQCVRQVQRLVRHKLKRAGYLAFVSQCRRALQLLLNVFIRAIPCRGGVPHTLIQARKTVHPVSKDMLAMHFKMTAEWSTRQPFPSEARKNNKRYTQENDTVLPAQGEQGVRGKKRSEKRSDAPTAHQQYLRSALNTNYFWTKHPSARHVLTSLREIQFERSLQKKAALEVLTSALASNCAFRVAVDCKVTRYRQQAMERKAQILKHQLDAEREQQRLIEERHLREIGREDRWRAAEQQAVKDKLQRDQAARSAAEEARRLSALQSSEARLRQRALAYARMRQLCEEEEHARQHAIAQAKDREAKRLLGQTLFPSLPCANRYQLSCLHAGKSSRVASRSSLSFSSFSLGSTESQSDPNLKIKVPWDDSCIIQRPKHKSSVRSSLSQLPPMGSKSTESQVVVPESSIASATSGKLGRPNRRSGRNDLHCRSSENLQESADVDCSQASLEEILEALDIPATDLCSAAWNHRHPAAAIRPATPVRRLLLVQTEIRLRHTRKQSAHRVKTGVSFLNNTTEKCLDNTHVDGHMIEEQEVRRGQIAGEDVDKKKGDDEGRVLRRGPRHGGGAESGEEASKETAVTSGLGRKGGATLNFGNIVSHSRKSGDADKESGNLWLKVPVRVRAKLAVGSRGPSLVDNILAVHPPG